MDYSRAEGSKSKLFMGAAILAAASLTARILGAVYRIPLAAMLGDEGMGLFEMANPIYFFLLSISVAGIPLAISKLIAEKKAMGDGAGARKVLRVAVIMMSATGIASTVALLALAPLIAKKVYHDPRAALPLMAIAPSLAFMTVMSALRGYFQGVQKMLPSAASQMTEQVARVAFMLLAAYLLLPKGLQYAAAGAAGGAAIGALVGLSLIVFLYIRLKKHPGYAITDGGMAKEKAAGIAARILALSVPVAITSSLASVKSVMDAAIVPGRLAAAGFATKEATALYGQLNGMAFPLVYFPTSIIAGLASATVPSVSECSARGDAEGIKERAIYVLKLTSLISFPATVGLFVLASPITDLLFARPDVGPLLAVMSWSSALLCLQQTSSSVLSGMGHVGDPLKSALAGVAVKAVLEFFLTAVPAFNVKGAALSTVVGSLVSVALNLMQLERRLGSKVGYARAFWRPALAAAAMGGAVWASMMPLGALFGSGKLTTIGAVGVGVIVYAAAILLLGGLTNEEMEAIPIVGGRLSRLSARLGRKRSRR